jgi:hypothetical protein
VAAREVGRYRRLHDVLHLWRLTAVAAKGSGPDADSVRAAASRADQAESLLPKKVKIFPQASMVASGRYIGAW